MPKWIVCAARARRCCRRDAGAAPFGVFVEKRQGRVVGGVVHDENFAR